MRKYNLGISVLLCCLAGGVFFWSNAFQNEGNSADDLGPAFWPKTLAIVLIVLAVVLAVQTLIQWRMLSADPINFFSPGMKRAYLMVAFLLVFCLVLRFVGFYVAAAILIPGCMFTIGERKPIQFVFVTAGILVSVYVIFDLLLSVPMPSAF